MSALIEVAHVAKRFRLPSESRRTVREHLFGLARPRGFTTLAVLRDVSFSLAPGETLGIMGRNGSGKSTLLKILCGIYLPDAGSVTVRAALSPVLELGLGWNSELGAVDNILLAATIMGMSLSQAKRSVDEILAFAELQRFADLPLKHYSTGMASRLAYTVAFSALRETLILDEVFAVGDAGFKTRCIARYQELIAAGHSAILASHEPPYVQAFCKRALLLDEGRIVMDDTGERVAEAYVQLAQTPSEDHRA